MSPPPHPITSWPDASASGDSRESSELLGSLWGTQALMLVLTATAAVAANRLDNVGDSVPWMSALQVPLLIALAAFWPGSRLPRTAVFWKILLTHAATAVLIGLAVGNSWRAVTIALGGVLYALVVGVMHRASSRHWVPRTPGGVVLLTGIAFVASPIPLWVSGYPGVTYELIVRQPEVALLATERGAIATMIGLNTFLVLFYAPRAAATWLAKPLTPLIVAGTLVAAWGLGHSAHPELAWTITLGPLAAALTMAPRAVAMLLIVMRMVTLQWPYAPHSLEPLYGVPPAVFVDLLIAFTVQTALAVSIARDQRCRLDDEILKLFAAEERQGSLLSTVFSTMNDGVVVTSPHGDVQVSNAAAQDLLGDPARVLDLASAPGSVVTVDTDEGEPRHLRVFRTPLAVEDQQLTLHLLDDATEELSRQRSLETFAGTVAHDLKGPLTAMLGWLDTAEDQLIDNDPLSARAALARADTATDRMDTMIDDYLAFAVVQDGARTSSDLSLSEIISEVADLYEGTDVVIEWHTPHAVHAESALVRQLLINLITNSVKYARPGLGAKIEIRSSLDGDWVQVEHADHGLGIQSGDEESIFEPFNRSAKDSATHQGVGLGLALCRSIVSRHGGAICAETNPWGGATFRFTLPRAEA